MPVLSRTIRIDDSRDVEIDVDVGQAQIATSIITVGDGGRTGTYDSSFTLNLGTGMAGKTVTCSTMVQDVRPETNGTTITFVVKNADTEFRKTLQAEARSAGDVVSYVARFHFRAHV